MKKYNPPLTLDKCGLELIELGYNIIPIARGKKNPPIKGWEKVRSDKSLLREWLQDGFGKCGVGVLTGNVIAIDIDVQDETIAKTLEDWCQSNIGIAPVRVGQHPKRLLVYRTEVPFTKFTSRSYDNPSLPDVVNSRGRARRPLNRIEALAEGQQFVAYAIHPDTGEPYQWLYGESLLDVPYKELPVVTKEQLVELANVYESLAEEAGWPLSNKSNTTSDSLKGVVRGEIDHDDPFAADVEKVDISDDELLSKLMLVEGSDDYHVWVDIGMALYHQYDGNDTGLEFWHKWSETAPSYDPDELDKKWVTFNISEKGRAPITARLILKLANEAAQKLNTETLREVLDALNKAMTIHELTEAAALAKKAEFSPVIREHIVGVVRTRFKIITGQNLGLPAARDMVRYENPSITATPHWLRGWVFVTSEDKYYNLITKTSMSAQAFNRAHSRYVLTKQEILEGKTQPDALPTNLADNIYQIQTVDGCRYMPGLDDIFTMNGVAYANSYTDRNVPDVPDNFTKRDLRNIEIVKNHFTHLFPKEREARIFLDYIAYVVQNPNKRPGWAVLIQGTEGDGKTFFGELLGTVLGSDNVRMLNAKTVQSDFNGWAEGQQVVFVEEIRLHGHNRYDILNQIKPLITNNVIEIHRKGMDPYNIPNTSSYILATNYRDALPITENDSRYFVLFSQYQTKVKLDEFKSHNPTYYEDLYNALEESAGALRGWLLNHELSEHFSAGNRAPYSESKGYMSMMAKSEEQKAIEELIEGSFRWDLTRELLSTIVLSDELLNMDVDVPYGRAMNKILSDMGFTYLGRIRNGTTPHRYWSMTPERFMKNGKVCTKSVRDWANMDL